MHRILKPTGSIYLHCDHTAGHYIKQCMDAIWGKENFRNEIIWAYTGPSNTRRWFPRKHDTLFFYVKSDSAAFNRDAVRVPYSEKYVKRFGKRYNEGKGNSAIFSGGHDTERNQQLAAKGKVVEDWWDDISPVGRSKNERVGAPDQKPIALYERIVKASSNEGDLVLDPFCGCATTIIAANNLGRRWVGIDRRKDARFHIVTRLMGVDKKERERLKKLADAGWLAEQEAKFESHYEVSAPARTDNEQVAAPELEGVYIPHNPHTHKEMKDALIKKFGVRCWGCNYEPPDERYLHLDHITPKSSGGTNHIDNRAVLCQPCNSKKGNRISLVELRKRNNKDGHTQERRAVDLKAALAWTRSVLFRKLKTQHD